MIYFKILSRTTAAARAICFQPLCSLSRHCSTLKLALLRWISIWHDRSSVSLWSAGRTSCRFSIRRPWTRRELHPGPRSVQQVLVHVRSRCFESLGRLRGQCALHHHGSVVSTALGPGARGPARVICAGFATRAPRSPTDHAATLSVTTIISALSFAVGYDPLKRRALLHADLSSMTTSKLVRALILLLRRLLPRLLPRRRPRLPPLPRRLLPLRHPRRPRLRGGSPAD